MVPVTFVIEGPLAQATGGYLYDRFVIEGLRSRGSQVDVLSLSSRGVVRTLAENARVALNLELHRNRVFVIDELCHPQLVLGASLHHRPRHAPLVALVHHLAASERLGGAARARIAVERALLSAADRIIVTSTTTRAVVVDAGVMPGRVRVVRPGRDRLGERSSPPLSGKDGLPRFLFIGSLTPRKAVLDLVVAFAEAGVHAQLTLVGATDRDPDYAARVRLAAVHAKPPIHILGEVSDASLAAELNRHDALILPSRYEGYGIVLAEALSYGLAIVATRAGAIPEVVRDGLEAILVSPGDVRALAAAMVRVAGDRSLLTNMQHEALIRAGQLPRWIDTQAEFTAALVS